MSSSSGRYDNDNSSSSISIPNISNLQLYDLEPYHQVKLVVTVITVILIAKKKELIGVSVVGNVAQWRRYRKFMLS